MRLIALLLSILSTLLVLSNGVAADAEGCGTVDSCGSCRSAESGREGLNTNYAGKVISVLGDSISTFTGYVPEADGYNLLHLSRYPQDNLLTDVNETWWMRVINDLGAKLGVNDSWRGAMFSGASAVSTGTTGENAALSNLQRLRNLGSNGKPDIILVYGGTNDIAHLAATGTFDPAGAPQKVDLTTTKWNNLSDAFVCTLMRLQHFYPDTEIIVLLPTFTKSYYKNAKLDEANAVMAAACRHYDIKYIDLRDCGISVADLPDGIHPNAVGMEYIAGAVESLLLKEPLVEAGENVVFSVRQEVHGVKSTLGYYKGISYGDSFVCGLTGVGLSVTLLMDGEDVTEMYCQDGVINIPFVTGDLTIKASADLTAGHAQSLPENICATTNIWAVLTHDTQYYSVNGWVVHRSGVVDSVTFDVVSGERIYASSFAAAPQNGSSSTNGIRVTFFLKDGRVLTRSTSEVYNEFTTNGGWIVVPENAEYVSIPMWSRSDEWEIYLLDREGVTSCLIGDADGDGEVTDLDGMLFERYLPGWENVEPDLEVLDIDGDGDISDWDSMLLDRYLAGWQVSFFHCDFAQAPVPMCSFSVPVPATPGCFSKSYK